MSRWLMTWGVLLACHGAAPDLGEGSAGTGLVVVPAAGALALDPCAAAPPSGTTGPGSNPFAAHALAPQQRGWIQGSVEERLNAGSYVYVRVRSATVDVWVATLAATFPALAAGTVRVLVLGRAERFHSSRLGRDFCPLTFGVVRPAVDADQNSTSKGT